MGNAFAIHSVGNSLITYLRKTYPKSLRDEFPCDFALLSSGEMMEVEGLNTTLSLFLYRISVNEHLRNAQMRTATGRAFSALPLELHYLLTIWAKPAVTEHILLAWAMLQLHQHPILDQSYLTPDAGWRPEETIQIVPTDISTEEMMRIWSVVTPMYRLSVGYTARVVHLDLEAAPDALPVVATRFGLGDREAEP